MQCVKKIVTEAERKHTYRSCARSILRFMVSSAGLLQEKTKVANYQNERAMNDQW